MKNTTLLIKIIASCILAGFSALGIGVRYYNPVAPVVNQLKTFTPLVDQVRAAVRTAK